MDVIKISLSGRALIIPFLFTSIWLSSFRVEAQPAKSGTNSTPVPAAATPRAVIEDRLVQLALDKSNLNKAMVFESQMADAEVRQAKMLWLDKVRLQGNLNEFTVQPDRYVRSQFFPRYNFSIGISLGDFGIIPNEVKKTRAAYEITRLGIDSQRQVIRTEVLKKYNHYVSIKDQLSIHKRLESETALNLGLMKTKFDRGEETYANYSLLIERHYGMLLQTKVLEESLEEAKLDLEGMIQTPLQNVL